MSSFDFDAFMAEAILPETTIHLCLRGDLVARLEDAEEALVRAQGEYDSELESSLGGSTPVDPALQAAVDDANAAVQAASRPFKLRGVSPRKWSDLCTANPPRKDFPGDAMNGFNPVTFFGALLRACLVDPVLTDEQFDRLQDKVSSGQWDRLCNACIDVSRRRTDVPFSHLASKTPPPSELK